MYTTPNRWRLSVLVFVLAATPAVAADLHFILFADTNDTAIGTIEDYNNSVVWAQTIADNTGLTLQLHAYKGADVTIDKTREVIDGLVSGPDDVIYFLYSGHGGNPDHRKWPVLYYTTTTFGDDVSFDEVVEALQAKQPRLLVVLADCCNNFLGAAGVTGPAAPAGLSSPLGQANFKRLFVDFQGTVLASGASPGQYSLGGSGYGGVFTNNFMATVQQMAESNPSLTWQAVASETITRTQEEAAEVVDDDGTPVEQVPQFVIAAGAVDSDSTNLGLDDSDSQTGDGLLYDDDLDDTPLGAPDGAGCGTGMMPTLVASSLMMCLFMRRRSRPV